MDTYRRAKRVAHTIRHTYGGKLTSVILLHNRIRCVRDGQMRETLLSQGGEEVGRYDRRAEVAHLAEDLTFALRNAIDQD